MDGFPVTFIADRHAIDHQAVQPPVLLNQLMKHSIAQRIDGGIHGIRWSFGIQPLDGCFEPANKKSPVVAFPLTVGFGFKFLAVRPVVARLLQQV